MKLSYRPWGRLDWIIERCNGVNWSLLGCLSPEDRSLAAWQYLCNKNAIHGLHLAEIVDPPSRFSNRVNERMREMRIEFCNQGGNTQNSVKRYNLFETDSGIIQSIQDFLSISGDSVVLDITSFPKRFFFPYVNYLIKNSQVMNLIVTYTVPESYTRSILAENFQEWSQLPCFLGAYSSADPDMLIGSIGYMPMGLAEQIEINSASVHMLFPFPEGPISFKRTWDFVRMTEKNLSNKLKISRVALEDTSDAFDHIKSITNNGQRSAIFAPYGPKPISLAMALFASLTESPVYYTQPKAYNPDYSTGVSTVDGVPEIYAYCIRLNGKNFYTV